ncbi:MAG: hypothetical protein P1V36_17890, partial [Planctomycetota bacterium]|nr:hypothetical protein [Planctomycetota bacterium]
MSIKGTIAVLKLQGRLDTAAWAGRNRKAVLGVLNQASAPAEGDAADAVAPPYAPWMDPSPAAKALDSRTLFRTLPPQLQRMIRVAAVETADEFIGAEGAYIVTPAQFNPRSGMERSGYLLRYKEDWRILVPAPAGIDAASAVAGAAVDFILDADGESWHTPAHANPNEHGVTTDYYGLTVHEADVFVRWLYALFAEAQAS